MRKTVTLFATLAMLLLVAFPVYAQQERVDVYKQQRLVKSVVFQVGLNEYFVNNQVPGVKMDVAPFIENGRTFVPVRFLANALGVWNIYWSEADQRVELREPGFPTVEMTVGKVEVLSNGQPVPGVDVAPILRNDRTFLPARFVAQALGYEVDWDPALNLVICWPKGEPRPDIEAVKKYVREVVGKPEAVKELERLFGVVMAPVGSSWSYRPSLEEQKRDQERSYFALNYGGPTEKSPEAYIVEVSWYRGLSDIRNVNLDLSPIEKVLSWKFPDQPDKVQEIMAYAWQVAEKTRSSDGFERLPWRDYLMANGNEVSVGSIGGCFVEVIIRSKPLDPVFKQARDSQRR